MRASVLGGAFLRPAASRVTQSCLCGLFCTGGTLQDPGELPQGRSSSGNSTREIVSPIEVGLFAGAVDLEKYPFFVRLMVKLMKAETGNFRD